MRILFLVLFFLLFPLQVLAGPNVKRYTIHYNNSQVHIIRATPSAKKSVALTLKGHKAGINCSYFNMNTRKTVPYGMYNRPFILIKEDNTIEITDNALDIWPNDKIASAGSWLIKDEKPYSTQDHFTESFKNMKVNRTCVGLDKYNNVYLIVVKQANFNNLRKIGLRLGLERMVNVDGGTSSYMKYNSKIIVRGKRTPVNYLVIE